MARAKDSIDGLTNASIIALKESKTNPVVQKAMMALCIIKGKTPTWDSARKILNPLTFKMEVLRTDVEKLRPENVLRAQEWLDEHRDLAKALRAQRFEAAARVLEWVRLTVVLSRTSVANYNPAARLVRPKTEAAMVPMKPAQVANRTQTSFGVARKLESRFQFEFPDLGPQTRGSRRPLRQPWIAPATSHEQRRPPILEKGPGLYGETSGDFHAMPEAPLAILRGRGDKKAIIMKTPSNGKPTRTLGSEKDSARLLDYLDKLVENKAAL